MGLFEHGLATPTNRYFKTKIISDFFYENFSFYQNNLGQNWNVFLAISIVQSGCDFLDSSDF